MAQAAGNSGDLGCFRRAALAIRGQRDVYGSFKPEGEIDGGRNKVVRGLIQLEENHIPSLRDGHHAVVKTPRPFCKAEVQAMLLAEGEGVPKILRWHEGCAGASQGYIAMEDVGMNNLYEYFRGRDHTNVSAYESIAHQLVRVISRIHGRGCYHFDIDFRNVVVHWNCEDGKYIPEAYLSDFGAARISERVLQLPQDEYAKPNFKVGHGAQYVPFPIECRLENMDPLAADRYALGMFILKMFGGIPRGPKPALMPNDVLDFVTGLTSMDMTKRFASHACLEMHPFIKRMSGAPQRVNARPLPVMFDAKMKDKVGAATGGAATLMKAMVAISALEPKAGGTSGSRAKVGSQTPQRAPASSRGGTAARPRRNAPAKGEGTEGSSATAAGSRTLRTGPSGRDRGSRQRQGSAAAATEPSTMGSSTGSRQPSARAKRAAARDKKRDDMAAREALAESTGSAAHVPQSGAFVAGSSEASGCGVQSTLAGATSAGHDLPTIGKNNTVAVHTRQEVVSSPGATPAPSVTTQQGSIRATAQTMPLSAPAGEYLNGTEASDRTRPAQQAGPSFNGSNNDGGFGAVGSGAVAGVAVSEVSDRVVAAPGGQPNHVDNGSRGGGVSTNNGQPSATNAVEVQGEDVALSGRGREAMRAAPDQVCGGAMGRDHTSSSDNNSSSIQRRAPGIDMAALMDRGEAQYLGGRRPAERTGHMHNHDVTMGSAAVGGGGAGGGFSYQNNNHAAVLGVPSNSSNARCVAAAVGAETLSIRTRGSGTSGGSDGTTNRTGTSAVRVGGSVGELGTNSGAGQTGSRPSQTRGDLRGVRGNGGGGDQNNSSSQGFTGAVGSANSDVSRLGAGGGGDGRRSGAGVANFNENVRRVDTFPRPGSVGSGGGGDGGGPEPVEISVNGARAGAASTTAPREHQCLQARWPDFSRQHITPVPPVPAQRTGKRARPETSDCDNDDDTPFPVTKKPRRRSLRTLKKEMVKGASSSTTAPVLTPMPTLTPQGREIDAAATVTASGQSSATTVATAVPAFVNSSVPSTQQQAQPHVEVGADGNAGSVGDSAASGTNLSAAQILLHGKGSGEVGGAAVSAAGAGWGGCPRGSSRDIPVVDGTNDVGRGNVTEDVLMKDSAGGGNNSCTLDNYENPDI